MNDKLIGDVMDMLLAGNDEMRCQLRKQYEIAKIVNEEYDAVGFYIDYKVDKFQLDTKKYPESFSIGDVYGTVNGVFGAVGFVLFVTNGFIKCLEGYTVFDNWPENDENIKLSYDISHSKF